MTSREHPDPARRPPGDSREQREAEAEILRELGPRFRTTFASRTFLGPEGTRVIVDGASDDPPVLVEAWAHHGKPKPAQKAKVMTDALKLVWVDRTFFDGRARKVLALADEAAAEHFRRGSWMSTALRDLGVEVHVVGLSEPLRQRVLAAQHRQRPTARRSGPAKPRRPA